MLDLMFTMYKGSELIMGKKKHNQNEKKKADNVEIINEEKSGVKSNSIFNIIIQNIPTILNILVSLGLITFMITFYGDFRELKSDVKHYETTMQSNSDNIEKIINNTITKELFSSTIDSLKSDLSGFKQSIGKQLVYTPTEVAKEKIAIETINNTINTTFLSSNAWNDDEKIAKSPNTGKKYKAKDLKNQKILLPYIENNQEIYFWGQFNNKHHWDGSCIINIYTRNRLEVIMEGLYDDGNLLSYRRISYHTNHSKIDVWNLSDRKPNEDMNLGVTYTYFKEFNYKKSFNIKNVESKDILSVSDFISIMKPTLEGFYYGETSNGTYNDKTNKSYLIKYFEDGTIRTLYCGQFKNGDFYDKTGNAWYISKGETDKNYVYFKGTFTNGKPDETDKHKRKNITNKEIHKIIDKMNFESNIKLQGDENVYS